MRMNNLKRWLIALALVAIPALSLADTVLITGANSGIGLEFTKQYAAKGWKVIATHRHDGVPPTLAEVSARFRNLQVERMDVSSQEEVNALAKKLADVPIDVLINNAGIYMDPSGDWKTQQFHTLKYPLMEQMFRINVAGPLMVSEAFYDNVKASRQKKIVSISSTNGSLTQPLEGSGAIFYRSSKAALNRAMQLVARQEEKNGITVALLHPGAVRTEKQRNLDYPGMVETPFTVTHMIETIDKLTIKDTGRFMLYDGTTVPW